MNDSNKSLIYLGLSNVMQTLQRSHLVRLRGYRLRADINDVPVKDLIASWRERQLPEGVLYTELCEHVPEWSEQAAAEIDYPTPFAFLEYSIIEPEHADDEIPDAFSSLGEQFDVVDGIYKLDFRLLNESTDGVPKTVMFNLFEIDGNSEFEQGFVMNWAPRAEFRSHDEGFFLQYSMSVSNGKRILLPSTERKLGMQPVMPEELKGLKKLSRVESGAFLGEL